jgi:PAS domain S-box-containing protein
VRQSPPGAAEVRQGFGWLKGLALVPFPVFIVLIIVFASFDAGAVIEPPYLLLALNLLFQTIIPFSIAYLAWRSYTNSGQLSLFFIGCGMVAFGLGALVAGLIINIPGGTNLTPVIHNTGALLGSILIGIAAIISLQKSPQYKLTQHRAFYLGLSYLAVIIFMSLFAIAAYRGMVPPFFVQGTGPTMLRQLVLGAATVLFAVSSIAFMRVSVRSASDFTYWLSLALVLITIGMCGIFLQKSVGSPIGWIGRAAQYLGCAYLLIGIVAAYRISNIKRIPLENELARSFDYIEANYQTLVEMAGDAIISADNKGMILSWNPAAARIFGYTVTEATGADVIQFIFPRESGLYLNGELQKLKRARGQAAEPGNKLETVARRKQGDAFPVEVSMAVKKVSGEWLGIFIIRDITDRKKAEDSLQKSENIMRGVFRAAPIGIGMVLNRVFVEVNDKFCEMLGYSRSELINQSARMIYPGDDDFNYVGKEKYAQIAEQGFGSVETRFKRKDGTVIDIILSSTQADTSDLAKGVIFTAQDITKRKQVEEALSTSESKYRSLVETAGAGVATIDLTGNLTFANQTLLKQLGYIEDEIIGKKFADFLDPEDSQRVQDIFMKGMVNLDNIPNLEFRLMGKDGHSIWYYSSPTLTSIGGVLTGAGAILTDITERKQMEESILRSKLLLQNVIDSTPDWMYVKDFQHKFLLVNKSFAEAQNLAPQEMIGRADTDFFPEELCLGNPDKGIRGFHADDNQAFKGQIVHNPRNIVTWADGSMHIYDTYKIPLADQSGKIYAALVYSRDITGQQEAEYEREAAFNTLQKTLHDVINTMSKIVEMRDPYTSGHQGRVAGLAGAIAREMKMDDSRVEHLMMAASIHDVGKMYVPADILSKPGRLSEIEWEMIKTHVQGSYEILKDLEFSQPIALMALQHHERLDGSGYPSRLKGSEMLIEAKILAVADVVEAMSSHRPYRPALGIDKALEEISGNKGRLYDPDVVGICVKLFKEQGFQFEG